MSLAQRTLRGVIWSFAERFSAQGIGFVVILVMARILTPADYGLVGMLTIFIQVGQSLADSGFAQALIRLRTRSESDICTAFYFNVLMGAAMYGLLWVLAPHISHYYDQPQLCDLSRVIGVIIPVSALMIVQRAMLSYNLDFRTQTRASLVAYTVSGVIGIWLAVSGAGVWAIAVYQVCTQTFLCLMLWILSRWMPRRGFSLGSFRMMFGFSSRLAVADLLDIVYRNAYLMVIGKVYKASDLGFFTKAQQVGGFLSANVSYIVQRVSYPSLCSRQGDIASLRSAFMKMLGVSSLCIFPVMWGLIVMSDEVIWILLGEKWRYAATLLPILCVAFMWHHVQSLNIQIMQVLGRSDLFLKMEIVKKSAGVALLAAAVPFGLDMLCWSFVGASVVALICNTRYTGRLCGANLWRQLRHIGPVFIVSGIVCGLSAFLTNQIHTAWIRISVTALAGIALYMPWVWRYRRSEMQLIIANLRTLNNPPSVNRR